MTPDAQRIAIGRAIGVQPELRWQVMNAERTSSALSGEKHECEAWLAHLREHHPESPYAGWQVGAWEHYPDYTGDLNAMHEAEKMLTGEQWDAYYFELKETITERTTAGWVRHGLIFLSAAQRAEAFLRTLGLWKDEL